MEFRWETLHYVGIPCPSTDGHCPPDLPVNHETGQIFSADRNRCLVATEVTFVQHSGTETDFCLDAFPLMQREQSSQCTEEELCVYQQANGVFQPLSLNHFQQEAVGGQVVVYARAHSLLFVKQCSLWAL